MTYTHLTMDELCWIELYFDHSTPVKMIAQKLSRSLQTIYNVVNALRAGQTIQEYYEKYRENKHRCGRRKLILSPEDISYIHQKQDQGWAPDVLVHHPESPLRLSVKTLYRCYREDERLCVKKLPMKGKRKPNGHIEARGREFFHLNISLREKMFPNFQNELGHLEGDTIVGRHHKSSVITLVERQVKSIITLKPEGRDAHAVAKRLDEWLLGLPRHMVKSITFDCGKEFSQWRQICNRHDIAIFFAHPGTPSERGLNENSNGLLRRDGLPKRTDFSKLSERTIQAIANFRNNIPRKSLGYKSPIEMLQLWISRRLSDFLA